MSARVELHALGAERDAEPAQLDRGGEGISPRRRLRAGQPFGRVAHGAERAKAEGRGRRQEIAGAEFLEVPADDETEDALANVDLGERGSPGVEIARGERPWTDTEMRQPVPQAGKMVVEALHPALAQRNRLEEKRAGRKDAGIGVAIDERAVAPDAAHRAGTRPRATRRASALRSDSACSRSGTESATMPAPA